MHQLSHDADIDLLMLITEQQREVKRLTERVEESSAAAREAKRDLKEAEKRLKALLEETIADRPLLKPREPEVAPVVAAPSPFSPENWINAHVHTLQLEDDTICELHAQGIQFVLQLIDAAVRDLPGLNRDQAVDVNHALRAFRHQLDGRSAEEFDAAVAEARAKAAPPATPEPEPERCPDCGGFLHLPTPKRKPRTKKACHLVRADGKAWAMQVPPEEVRAKRENPPEIQPLIEPAAPTLEEILEAESEADAETDGDWYSVPVGKLHLPETTLCKLIHAEFGSLEDVAGLLADDGFRALTNEPKLGFLEAAKVRAAMDLWWLEKPWGDPPWAHTDPDNCPADRARNEVLIDWLKRDRAGDTEPGWDRWSEFEVTLENGATVRVVYDPRTLTDSGHFDFHGPLTTTGYRSHFMPFGASAKPRPPIVKFAEDFAREIARDTAKEQAKEERRRKRAAKSKPVVETSETIPDGDLKHYMVYHGETGGDLYRVCLIRIGGDLLTAASLARSRIGWQVANFDHPLRLDGPGMETLLLAEGGRWLDTPRPVERNGESVKNNHTDQVPDVCPEGKPRVYKVVYHGTDGDRTLRFYSATTPKAAVEWAKRDYPSYQAWRMEAKPVDDDAPAKAAKRKAETQKAVRRLYEQGDRAAQERVEALPPDPAEVASE